MPSPRFNKTSSLREIDNLTRIRSIAFYFKVIDPASTLLRIDLQPIWKVALVPHEAFCPGLLGSNCDNWAPIPLSDGNYHEL